MYSHSHSQTHFDIIKIRQARTVDNVVVKLLQIY